MNLSWFTLFHLSIASALLSNVLADDDCHKDKDRAYKKHQHSKKQSKNFHMPDNPHIKMRRWPNGTVTINVLEGPRSTSSGNSTLDKWIIRPIQHLISPHQNPIIGHFRRERQERDLRKAQIMLGELQQTPFSNGTKFCRDLKTINSLIKRVDKNASTIFHPGCEALEKKRKKKHHHKKHHHNKHGSHLESKKGDFNYDSDGEQRSKHRGKNKSHGVRIHFGSSGKQSVHTHGSGGETSYKRRHDKEVIKQSDAYGSQVKYKRKHSGNTVTESVKQRDMHGNETKYKKTDGVLGVGGTSKLTTKNAYGNETKVKRKGGFMGIGGTTKEKTKDAYGNEIKVERKDGFMGIGGTTKEKTKDAYGNKTKVERKDGFMGLGGTTKEKTKDAYGNEIKVERKDGFMGLGGTTKEKTKDAYGNEIKVERKDGFMGLGGTTKEKTKDSYGNKTKVERKDGFMGLGGTTKEKTKDAYGNEIKVERKDGFMGLGGTTKEKTKDVHGNKMAIERERGSSQFDANKKTKSINVYGQKISEKTHGVLGAERKVNYQSSRKCTCKTKLRKHSHDGLGLKPRDSGEGHKTKASHGDTRTKVKYEDQRMKVTHKESHGNVKTSYKFKHGHDTPVAYQGGAELSVTPRTPYVTHLSLPPKEVKSLKHHYGVSSNVSHRAHIIFIKPVHIKCVRLEPSTMLGRDLLGMLKQRKAPRCAPHHVAQSQGCHYAHVTPGYHEHKVKGSKIKHEHSQKHYHTRPTRDPVHEKTKPISKQSHDMHPAGKQRIEVRWFKNKHSANGYCVQIVTHHEVMKRT